MYISTSAIATTSNITITEDGDTATVDASLFLPNFHDDHTFSANTDELIIAIDENVGFMALAGSNYSKLVSTIYFEHSADDAAWTTEETYTVGDFPSTLFYTFTSTDAYKRIRMTVEDTSEQLVIAYIQAGDVQQIPNSGEEGGFDYPWTKPQMEQFTALNNATPSRPLLKQTKVPFNLQLSTMSDDYARNALVPFSEFAIRSGFICGEDNEVDRAGYVMNVKTKALKANNQTRQLKSYSISGNAWTGRVNV